MKPTMTGCARSCSLEEKLHEDFLFYLKHTQWCWSMVPKNLQKQTGKWIKCLLSRKPETVEKMKLRNLHLSSLLLDMTFGKLRGIYAECLPPNPDEPLPPHPTAMEPEEAPEAPEEEPEKVERLPIPDWVQKIIDEEDDGQPSEAEKEPQLRHVSKDGRIYLATKALPQHAGAYGFFSMSTEKKREGPGDGFSRRNEFMDPEREDVCGDGRYYGPGTERYQKDTCPRPTQARASQLLAGRKPPEDRETLCRTYENLLSLVERAMKGETIPRVEMMLEQLWNDVITDPAYDYLNDLPPYAVRNELLKTLLDNIILKRGRLMRREAFLRRMEGRVPAFCGGNAPVNVPRRCDYDRPAPSYPNANRQASCPYSDKARHALPIITAAKEELEAEAAAEFNEKLKCLREEISLDKTSAMAAYQRARVACETAHEASEKLKKELQNMDAGSRRRDALDRQLALICQRKDCLSRALEEGMERINTMRRKSIQCRETRQMEIDAMQCELRDKELRLADLMEYYGEVLRQRQECEDSDEPEEPWC